MSSPRPGPRLAVLVGRHWGLLLGLGVLWLAAEARAGRKAIIQYEVLEEEPKGTAVGNVRHDSRLWKKIPEDVFNQLNFTFLHGDEGMFRIDRASGLLETSSRIDREKVPGCAHQETCHVVLDVAVRPVEYFHVIKVSVEIKDINDNSPMFPEFEITHPILESAAPGSSFVIPTASDLDSPPFGIARYRLESEGDIFGLRVIEKLDSFNVRLTVNKALDREQTNQYTVRVFAEDGGTPPRSGSLTILIPILDSNDNSPIFDNSTYEVSVREGLGTGTSLLQVRATDRDIGQNSRVLYGFSPHTWETYGHLVTITNSTGNIVLVGNLDREEVETLNLIVTARDEGPGSVISDATVVIRVRDVNDNSPQITISSLGSTVSGAVKVKEGADVGTFVAHISVSDPDEGEGGKFNCTLGDFTFELQQTYRSEYKIVTTRVLDRETVSQYGLELVCRDHGTPPLVSIQTLTVTVEDENDNPPVFTRRSYTVSMRENNKHNQGVTQVVANDQDAGINAEIRYSMQPWLLDASDRASGRAERYFQVDEHTGAIKAKTSIDREDNQVQFKFYVVATDMGTPARSSSALVIINIEDVNDEVPQFVGPKFTFSIYEDEPIGTEVGKVTAVDRDSPSHSHFRYDLATREEGRLPFSLDEENGRLSLTQKLDREVKDYYRLTVLAKDIRYPTMFSNATVAVNVLDENDNAPNFLFPSKQNNTLVISSQVPVGYLIAKLTARDIDKGNNASVTYHIRTGNEEGILTLEKLSGKLFLGKQLDPAKHAQFYLTVLARDGGKPPLTGEAELKIIINKSLPFLGNSTHYRNNVLHYNIIVIASVACGGSVITLSLIVGILLVRNHGRRARERHKYRKEGQMGQAAKDGLAKTPEEIIPMTGNSKVRGELSQTLQWSLELNCRKLIAGC